MKEFEEGQPETPGALSMIFIYYSFILVNLLYSITFAKIISIYTVYSIIIMMNNTKQNTTNPEDITLQ